MNIESVHVSVKAFFRSQKKYETIVPRYEVASLNLGSIVGYNFNHTDSQTELGSWYQQL